MSRFEFGRSVGDPYSEVVTTVVVCGSSSDFVGAVVNSSWDATFSLIARRDRSADASESEWRAAFLSVALCRERWRKR